MTLDDFARSKGFPEIVGLSCDNTFYRFGRNGSQSSGWFKGKKHGPVVIARFGDWRTGEIYEYRGESKELTQEERDELEAELARIEYEERAKKLERQQEVSKECMALWERASVASDSPYLIGKGIHNIASTYGCRVDTFSETAEKYGSQLLVPAFDIRGKLWGLQRISRDGFKSFKEGMRIKGCFCKLASEGKEPVVILCEGIATAASIFSAFEGKISVFSCFNAGNLENVALKLRAEYPECRIVIAADNDQWTTKPDGNGGETPWNPGYEAACAAAEAAGKNSAIVSPNFEHDHETRGTDWNDWHLAHGLVSVKQCIEPALHRPKEEDSGAGVPKKKDDQPPGRRELPSHQDIADRVYATFSGTLLKQERSLFFYNKIYWRELRAGDIDSIKQQIQASCGHKAKASKIDDIYKLFVQRCPHVGPGKNLHSPPTWLANFENGSLHVFKTQDHEAKYSLVFREHQSFDYATNVLPYEYKDDWSEQNAEFEAMLDRIFKDDPDAVGKRRALAQMFGACLIPAFPHLFMNWGTPGTGKSTVIILAAKLAHPENCCSVDPTEWEGFNMESMVGKLVNYDTDIEVAKPITDKAVKKVIDRVSVRIRRKGIADVYGPLPATHLFGGNEIPKTLDGRSGAMTRRWTFIEYSRVIAKESGDGKSPGYEVDFVDRVWKAGYRGVLNFALKGLADLLEARGHFFQPESGKAKMKEWQLSTDVVGTFWKELEEGLIYDDKTQVMLEKEAEMGTVQLFEVFANWHESTFRRVTRVSRIAFNRSAESRGLKRKIVRGVHYWVGVGVKEKGGGEF